MGGGFQVVDEGAGRQFGQGSTLAPVAAAVFADVDQPVIGAGKEEAFRQRRFRYGGQGGVLRHCPVVVEGVDTPNAVDHFQLVATDDLSTLESQDILRGYLSGLGRAGKDNVEAIKSWRSALGPEPWHYRVHDAIKGTETTVSDITNLIAGKYYY